MSTLLAGYSYNALNRRIIEDDGTTATHLFYSANWQVLEEQVSGQTTTQYVWSPVYIDALILRDRDTDSDGDLDERLYVQQDANWNVTALVDALTGNVIQRFVQDPFGLVTDILDDTWSPQSDAFEWKYLHQGLRLDMAVGMNLYDGRNRIYDPVLQRWLQVDPSGYQAGDPNLYRVEGNNVTNVVDFSGLIGIFFEGTGFRKQDSIMRRMRTEYEKGGGTVSPLYEFKNYGNIRRGPARKEFFRQITAALNFIKTKLADPDVKDKEVDLFGFSRGAVAAVWVAHLLSKERPSPEEKPPIKVRYMGLIDPSVTWLGLDPQELLKATTVPENVKTAWVYYAGGVRVVGVRHLLASAAVSNIKLTEKIDGTIHPFSDPHTSHYTAGHWRGAGYWIWPFETHGLPLQENPYKP